MVGLTGGIGSGKSTVAALLVARGGVVIDADLIARQVVEPGTPALAQLVERFGGDILDESGELVRSRLAEKAFVDAQSRLDLEAITHPAIGAEFLRQLGECGPDSIVIHDVPLLAESHRKAREGGAKTLPEYEFVIVVEAPLETRLERLEARGIPRDDAQRRIAQQASDEDRRGLATWVVDNSGDLAHLEAQVDTIWKHLTTQP
jgi:dephospho-CoA kinase